MKKRIWTSALRFILWPSLYFLAPEIGEFVENIWLGTDPSLLDRVVGRVVHNEAYYQIISWSHAALGAMCYEAVILVSRIWGRLTKRS